MAAELYDVVRCAAGVGCANAHFGPGDDWVWVGSVVVVVWCGVVWWWVGGGFGCVCGGKVRVDGRGGGCGRG